MMEELQQLEKNALAELQAATTEEHLLAIRTKYLGRKGLLTLHLRKIAQVQEDKRAFFGKRCNEVKELIVFKIEEALKHQSEREKETVFFKAFFGNKLLFFQKLINFSGFFGDSLYFKRFIKLAKYN